MSVLNCVSFRGSGSESTGSIAHNCNGSKCPNCSTGVSFKANNITAYGYREEKKSSLGKWILGLAGATALVICGLAYGYKPAVNKLKNGALKDFIKKLEPSAKECRKWCDNIHKKGSDCWNNLKKTFKKS